MKDGIIKGTGNSRFLKSSIPARTTWEEALAMLIAGTFPVDLNGINADGWQQTGTPLNKENILTDPVAEKLGFSESDDPSLNDALEKISVTKAPAYTKGTEDLTAGVSQLETDKLHLVYE